MDDLTKKKLKGAVRSRTNYLALAFVLLGFALQDDTRAVLATYVSPKAMPTIVSLLGLALLIVRWQTTQALEHKSGDQAEEEPPEQDPR